MLNKKTTSTGGLIYDLPTRIFHWSFSFLFLSAFAIAKTIDDESVVFSFHMLAGLTLGFFIFLRLLWGFLGSTHARFNDFALDPRKLIQYFENILGGKEEKWAGHNPASSWAALIMMFCALGLVSTGFLMTSGSNKEAFEDLHEVFGNSLFVIAVIHILGIFLHTIRFKEWIGLSMVTGKKVAPPPHEAIESAHAGVALLLVALGVSWGVTLYQHFNPATRQLNLLGITLQLGEGSTEEVEEPEQESEL